MLTRIGTAIKRRIQKYTRLLYRSVQRDPYVFLDDYRLTCLKNGLAMTVVPKIAFYVSSVSHIDHYKRIWRHLDQDQYVVLVPANLSRPATRRELPLIFQYLRQERVPHKTMEAALGAMEQYPVMLTKHRDLRTEMPGADIAQVYVRYMIHGVEKYSYRPSQLAFDLFLCQSDYQVRRVKAARADARCALMGYPRLDDLFVDTPIPPEFDGYVRPERKTILYLPTHGPWSSVKSYLTVVAELSDVFNVIIKPHYASFTEHPTLFGALRENDYLHIISDSTINDWAFFKLADVVLVDCGGSVFAAIYALKDVVFLRNDASPSPVSEEEERLSREFPTVTSPDAAAMRLVLNSEALLERHRPALLKARDEFSSPVCENGGQKAAAILVNELERCLNHEDSMGLHKTG